MARYLVDVFGSRSAFFFFRWWLQLGCVLVWLVGSGGWVVVFLITVPIAFGVCLSFGHSILKLPGDGRF